MHKRVVNVRAAGAWDVYVGRGRCPQTAKLGEFGNPFPVDAFGPEAMTLYLRWLSGERFGVAGLAGGVRDFGPDVVEKARRELPGKVLACWCAPRLCHGEVLARLADGEELAAIAADVCARLPLPLPQGELFGNEGVTRG